MQCPADRSELEKVTPHGVAAARCPSCNGLWFSAENLRLLKDAEDSYLRWIDVDLWAQPERFLLTRPDGRVCPEDGQALYRAAYGDSRVTVDVCSEGHGVWLDEGEFRAIIDWMRARVAQESFAGYAKDLGKEALEVVFGPEGIRSEALDFLVVAKLLAYRLLARFPAIAGLIAQLPA